MDNTQTFDYITISRNECMELLSKKLNYKHLLDAMLEKAKYNPYMGGLEFDQQMINHILCALETDRFFETLYKEKEEYEKEMERIANVYGNNQSGE